MLILFYVLRFLFYRFSQGVAFTMEVKFMKHQRRFDMFSQPTVLKKLNVY